MENTVQNPKIWYPHEIFYIESMLTITRSVMVNQSRLKIIIDELEIGETKNRDLVIDIVQNIVMHAASISRYFWPSSTSKLHKRRGQKLRKVLGIQESNPIRQRDVRNFIEHFDEKLDIYLEENIGGVIFPVFIGTKKSLDKNVSHFFRAYFIDERRFQVLGMEYNIAPIINELARIHKLLEEFQENGGRLPN